MGACEIFRHNEYIAGFRQMCRPIHGQPSPASPATIGSPYFTSITIRDAIPAGLSSRTMYSPLPSPRPSRTIE